MLAWDEDDGPHAEDGLVRCMPTSALRQTATNKNAPEKKGKTHKNEERQVFEHDDGCDPGHVSSGRDVRPTKGRCGKWRFGPSQEPEEENSPRSKPDPTLQKEA